MLTTTTQAPSWTTSTIMPFTTLMPEGTCDRAMDLAFLLDGSAALSEDEFHALKEFIVGVVERFRMGSAHTRATVLLYHSGVKTYDLQVYDPIIYNYNKALCVFMQKRATTHSEFFTSLFLQHFYFTPVGSEVAV